MIYFLYSLKLYFYSARFGETRDLIFVIWLVTTNFFTNPSAQPKCTYHYHYFKQYKFSTLKTDMIWNSINLDGVFIYENQSRVLK